MVYLFLGIAIAAEVIATSALKPSEGFTRLIPSILVVGGYGLAFYFLALVLKTLPMCVTYAIWAGLGVALITLVGVFFYKQPIDLPAIIGLSLIVAGVCVLNFFSDTVSH